MEGTNIYDAKDVMVMLGVKRPTAYRIIQTLNKELKDLGCYTVAGRVSKTYFDEKFYIKKAPGQTGASK